MKFLYLSIIYLLSFTNLNAQDTPDTATFSLIDIITLKDASGNDHSYRFRVQSDDNVFKLKTCLGIEACKEAQDFIKTMNEDAFLLAVMIQINTAHGTSFTAADLQSNGADVKIKNLLKEVDTYDDKQVRAKLTEAQNNLRNADTAKDRYAGVLSLNTDGNIPYRKTTYKLKPEYEEKQLLETLKAEEQLLTSTDKTTLDSLNDTQNAYLQLQLDKGLEGFSKDSIVKSLFDDEKRAYYYLAVENNNFSDFDEDKYDKITQNGSGELKVINATVNFFNNKASLIIINATLTENGKTEHLTFINSKFSVPIRYFNTHGSVVFAYVSHKKINNSRDKIAIDYNDIFNYHQYKDTYSYAVANTQVELGKDEKKGQQKSTKIPQRRFFDYFTAIAYSDLMGFNTEAPNALVNAQARLLIPLNLRNWGKWTMARQFTTITNIALQNSFDDDNRFINISENEQFSNFDLLRKNNLYGKFSLELLTHEAKGWYTNIGLGYNVGFYRTGFRYTLPQNGVPDDVTTTQLFALSHGPFLNFEIRPQTNFGADVSISIEDLNFAGDQNIDEINIESKISNDGKDHFVMPFNIINLEANFYWLTNPETSVGGLYAKLGGFFHTETNTIFPQFMVGYATNLTSFVDRFKKPKKVEAPTID